MANKKLKKKQKYIARKIAKRVETATIKPTENALGVEYGKCLRNANGAEKRLIS